MLEETALRADEEKKFKTDVVVLRARRKSPLHKRPIVLGGLVAAVLIAVGVSYYIYARGYESTDDAFIQGHVVAVSPKIASYVSQVLIDDNSHVKQGDLLVELDPRDFETQLAQARANLEAVVAQHQSATINVRVVDTTSNAGVQQAQAAVETVQRQVDAARSQLEQAKDQVLAAQSQAKRSRDDEGRSAELIRRDLIARQEFDHAVADAQSTAAQLAAAHATEQSMSAALRQAESQLEEARARLVSARAAPDQVAYSRSQAEQVKAQVAQLEAAVRQAELNLSYTKIYAPESGRITRKSVEPGAYVQAGQTFFSIVPDRVWVLANFKETQLRYMRPGQPVTIKVDAYPDKVFKGHVDSIQAGSGAAFSLLPPENATGNYVKVVQRVPVKILIDDPPDPNHVLGPGMSVVPEVKVR